MKINVVCPPMRPTDEQREAVEEIIQTLLPGGGAEIEDFPSGTFVNAEILAEWLGAYLRHDRSRRVVQLSGNNRFRIDIGYAP